MKKYITTALIALGIVASAIGISYVSTSGVPASHACNGSACG